MAKITDKIAQHLEENPGKPYFSFEFFPPKTEVGVRNLYDRFDRMAVLNPMWIDVTWGAGGSTSDTTLELCINALKYHSLDVMMHLTCTNMSKEKLFCALTTCKNAGIRNILALRGDPPKDNDAWVACEGGFAYASDLVRYIREEFGDFFCIAVAGYPEMHLESTSAEEDLRMLKLKVDQGADLVITQLFFDNNEFINFVDRCRAIGITIPILPGIMPIQNYAGFRRMTEFCKTKVPQSIEDALEPIKGNPEAVKDYGVELAVEMCQDLVARGVPGLHFYTLNLETTVMRIIDRLQLVADYNSTRKLPWRPSCTPGRESEDVRPIFWANRQKSYVQRTAAWDDFPNGRFSSRASPAFGEFFISMCGPSLAKYREESLAMWGAELKDVADVGSAFESFLKGDVSRLPWCDMPVNTETNFIAHQLKKMIRMGLLTINSQPRVNGALSTDPNFGWGPANGFVYQKAYAEFFCSPEVLDRLLATLESPAFSFSFTAVNSAGDVKTNIPRDAVTAVTWGVFPQREIVQPTIHDQLSLMAWKDEAFALWKEWESLYDAKSTSQQVIENIRESYYLVTVVDNNFVCGDLFGELIKAMQ